MDDISLEDILAEANNLDNNISDEWLDSWSLRDERLLGDEPTITSENLNTANEENTQINQQNIADVDSREDSFAIAEQGEAIDPNLNGPHSNSVREEIVYVDVYEDDGNTQTNEQNIAYVDNQGDLDPISLRRKKVDYQYVAGQKRDSQLIFSIGEKQLYKKSKKNNKNGKSWWTCTTTGCTERITLHSGGKCYYSDKKKGHKHEQKEELQQQTDLLDRVKTEIKQVKIIESGTKSETVRRIFNEIVTSESESGISYKAHERGLLKILDKALLKPPKDCVEIKYMYTIPCVVKKYGWTKRNISNQPPSMYYKTASESQERSFCVFSSDDIVEAIGRIHLESRRYFIDASFKMCLQGIFKHLLVLSGDFKGQIIPFCSVLLDRKTEQLCTDIFQYIDQNVIKLYGNIFVADYENTMRTSLEKIFPQSKLDPSWFHYTQAVKILIKKFPALEKRILNKDDAQELYYKLQALPLLPKEKILPAYKDLKSQAMAQIHAKKFDRFLKIYEQEWIQSITTGTISVFGVPIQATCALEEYNSILGRKIKTRNNFFKLVEVLLDEEKDMANKVKELDSNGGSNANHLKKEKTREKDLSDIIKKSMKNGEIDSNVFLCVACKTKTLMKDMLKFDVAEDDDDLDDSSNADEAAAVASSQSCIDLCGICGVNRPDAVPDPCGHLYCCLDCWNKWISTDPENAPQNTPKCLICKADVTSMMRLMYT